MARARIGMRRSSWVETLEARQLLSTVVAPLADAYVRGGSYANSNYGSATNLLVEDSTTTSSDYQSYLKFNTGSAAIQKAVLQLTPIAKGTKMQYLTVRIRLLADAADGWTESGLNWNNKADGVGNVITIAGTQFTNRVAVNVDVTSLVNQAAINANGIATFQVDVVSAPNSKPYVSFASDEYKTATYRPKLTITVAGSNFLGLVDAELANLTQSLYNNDGKISRVDLIQIIQSSVSDDGVVNGDEFADLRTILVNAATLSMPNYVKVLGSDVVDGNIANAHYQGTTLGNLAAGDSATKLTKLVNKWFYGTDHPATNYNYVNAAGPMYIAGPGYADTLQGALGDCYLIATLGSIAKSNPAAIENMFIDNGDGTYTVRFYYYGTADFVTVDRMLPTMSNGLLVYDGYYQNPATAELWLPMAEKAYAQWNETGKEERDGTNRYAALEGGWMEDVDRQVLGQTPSTYWWFNDSYQSYLNAGIDSGKAVQYATNSNPGDGLYGPHAYIVTGRHTTNGILYYDMHNPWGDSHPGPLTWAQLKANGQCFTVADASVTVPPTGLAAAPAAVVFSSLSVDDVMELVEA